MSIARFVFLIALAGFPVVLASGCRAEQASSGGSQQSVVTVVATTPMIADLAAEIGGPDANVRALLKPGVDPHTYQPNAADIRALTGADVVLFNGLKLEAMEPDLKKLATSKPGRVVAVAAAIPTEKLRTPPDFEGHPDPHVWMDVQLWSLTVPAIVTALSAASPNQREAFEQRAAETQQRLEKLDSYVRDVVQTIPEAKRHLITAHDAFGYFALAYGIEVSSVQGVTTESEAGLGDVQRLVDLIVEKEIPAVFVESSVTDRNVTAVLEGARAKGATVNNGGSLFSDSAGAPGTWTGTYYGMIDHNVNTLAAGLGGQVPDGGYRAKHPCPLFEQYGESESAETESEASAPE